MSQTDALVFDHDTYKEITEARKAHADFYLDTLVKELSLETALDVGCGVGSFSGWLAAKGLRVTGVDGRLENIDEARRRYPQVEFQVANVEDPLVKTMGQFDLVLCYGLLYHLENPFQALRNLFSVTEKILLMESRVIPYEMPAAFLMDECVGEDQGLNHMAFVPSRQALVNMLYASGFLSVFRPRTTPQHKEFQSTSLHHNSRSMLVASKVALHKDSLLPVPYRGLRATPDIWERKGRPFFKRILGYLHRQG